MFLMFYIFYVKWQDLYILMQMLEQDDREELLHWIGEVEPALYHKGDDITKELEENLERLTLDILDADIDDIPMRYHRSTVGVPGQFIRLLRRVAQAVMCYHEHH